MNNDRIRDDRIRIVEQLAELAAAIDARNWDGIRHSFLPDGYGYGAQGADAIIARMQDHLGGCGPTQHLLGNHRVTLDGDRARSLTYARVYHEGAGPMRGRFFECMGEYDDRWLRTQHGWRLASRSFDMRITRGDFEVLRPEE